MSRIFIEMSWMTPDYIMRMFDKESGLELTAKEIKKRLGEELKDNSLNRHLRRLTGARFGFALRRYRDERGYVYHKRK